MDTQFKKGILELCVLATLATEDLYGYELTSRISRTIAITEGTIYPLLRRLKEEGLLVTYLEESSGGPPRKYYQLTAKGKRALKEQRGEWETFSKQVDTILHGGKR